MDFDIDLNEIVEEVLDRNKKLILENIVFQKSLIKAAQLLEQTRAELDGLHKEVELFRAWQAGESDRRADQNATPEPSHG